MNAPYLPFPALVGLDLAQQALILLAIEPRLRGVALAAPAGTGKSSLARGMRDLLGAVPFVEVPPSIDAENLLGGVDLEATLRTGSLVLQQGVLARAHGGLAYVDGINLLQDATVNSLLSVLDSGLVTVEREGVSARDEAVFSLIASYDPAEGLPRRHLLDRIGLLVPLPQALNTAQRATVVRRNLLEDVQDWNDDITFIQGVIAAACEHLPQVTIDDAQLQQISAIALAYGVEGHRADLFTVWAACAAAAAELRDAVTNEDIELAVRLVILPRATQVPSSEPDTASPPPQAEAEPNEPAPSQQSQPESQEADNDEGQASAPPADFVPPPEQILEALDSALPEQLEELPFLSLRRGQTGSRGATEGQRGRHISSVPGDPRQGRIDVVATLRTAAPWQPLRAAQHPHSAKRLHLAMSDVRVKRYRSKAGALFCFAVDASGSMALHRMRQAKGAVHNLLEKAYVERDRVALIAFRGQDADLLLPPSQSVELARRALDLLPTGGGTPLASALLLAGDVAAQARMRGILQTVLVLLTDGRGNVGLYEDSDPQAELAQLGAHVRSLGMRVIVVDTKRNYLSRGEARQLAEWLGADYAYLPNGSSEQISDLAMSARE